MQHRLQVEVHADTYDTLAGLLEDVGNLVMAAYTSAEVYRDDGPYFRYSIGPDITYDEYDDYGGFNAREDDDPYYDPHDDGENDYWPEGNIHTVNKEI